MSGKMEVLRLTPIVFVFWVSLNSISMFRIVSRSHLGHVLGNIPTLNPLSLMIRGC
jgi:hypothetical protein